MELFVESACVANGQAVAVASPQCGRVRRAVGTCDAGLFDSCLIFLFAKQNKMLMH